MSKKVILFALNTEFALLIALLFLRLYKKEAYEPIWLLLKSTDNRFKHINTSMIPGRVFVFLDNLNSRERKIDLSFIDELKNLEIEEFVHQNNYRISNQIIKSKIKKTLKREVLIADGLGLNVKRSFKFKLNQNIVLLFRKYFSRMYGLPIKHIDSVDYIKTVSCYINSHPLPNVSTKFISFSDLFLSVDDASVFGSIFDFKFEDNYDVYFFTQPITSKNFTTELSEKYFEIIEKLVDLVQRNKKKLLIKVHPGEVVDKYLKFQGPYCEIGENNNIPAELFFYFIKNKKIISFFSSVSLMDFSKANKHYWLFPLIDYSPAFSVNTKDIMKVDSLTNLDKLIS